MKTQALGRSRGGLTTKIHLVSDANGIPLGVAVSPGQAHEAPRFETVMNSVVVSALPEALAGDRAYSSGRIRCWLEDRNVEPVIPFKSYEHKKTLGFDTEAYRGRNVVERLAGWLKEFRRVATRFEQLARNYVAIVTIACTKLILRRYPPGTF